MPEALRPPEVLIGPESHHSVRIILAFSVLRQPCLDRLETIRRTGQPGKGEVHKDDIIRASLLHFGNHLLFHALAKGLFLHKIIHVNVACHGAPMRIKEQLRFRAEHRHGCRRRHMAFEIIRDDGIDLEVIDEIDPGRNFLRPPQKKGAEGGPAGPRATLRPE